MKIIKNWEKFNESFKDEELIDFGFEKRNSADSGQLEFVVASVEGESKDDRRKQGENTRYPADNGILKIVLEDGRELVPESDPDGDAAFYSEGSIGKGDIISFYNEWDSGELCSPEEITINGEKYGCSVESDAYDNRLPDTPSPLSLPYLRIKRNKIMKTIKNWKNFNEELIDFDFETRNSTDDSGKLEFVVASVENGSYNTIHKIVLEDGRELVPEDDNDEGEAIFYSEGAIKKGDIISFYNMWENGELYSPEEITINGEKYGCSVESDVYVNGQPDTYLRIKNK